jgi:hypothetical protein
VPGITDEPARAVDGKELNGELKRKLFLGAPPPLPARAPHPCSKSDFSVGGGSVVEVPDAPDGAGVSAVAPTTSESLRRSLIFWVRRHKKKTFLISSCDQGDQMSL